MSTRYNNTMNGLEITDVKIFEPSDKQKKEQPSLKARASFVLNDAFRVTGVRIIDGQNGLYASMPMRKDDEDNFWNVVVPLNRDLYTNIQDELVHQYVVWAANN